MGYINYVRGFIQLVGGERAFNENALNAFAFDEDWPLPRIFCFPDSRGRIPLIHFAMAFRGRDEEWVEWVPRFEQLLGSLKAMYARMDWEREGDEDLLTIPYICMDSQMMIASTQPPDREWTKLVRFKLESEGMSEMTSQEIIRL